MDSQDFQMKLFYFSGWKNPRVLVKPEGAHPFVEIPMDRSGAGRVEGEDMYEAAFTLSRRGGFFIRAEHGSEDRPPGSGFYRPLAREIYLADGEFFLARPSAMRTGAIYKDIDFYWKELNHRFKIHLMLPRNYSSGGAPYPVCVLNDGQNQWRNQGAYGGWHTNVITSRLCRKGRCRDVVMVSVESTGFSRDKYYVTPPTGRNDLYVSFLAAALLPALRRDFNLSDRPDETGIVGASYGAHCAVYAGLARPDVFGLIGSLSFAAAPGRPLVPWLDRMPHLPFKKIYLDCGTKWAPVQKNPRTDNTRVTMGLIRQVAAKGLVSGVHLMGLVAQGHCHNEMYWRKRIGKCMSFLFSPL